MANSKQKGSAFELVFVKLIRKAVSRKYKDDICYRTPRSGGHPIIGGADIIIKPELRKIFPFAVECKHRKTIKIHSLFSETKQIKDFLAQSMENTDESGDNPLLVIRGTRTPILCASTLDGFKSAGYEAIVSSKIPGLVFRFRGQTWKMVLAKYVMKVLHSKVKFLVKE